MEQRPGAAGPGEQDADSARASPALRQVGVLGGQGLAERSLVTSMCHSLFGRSNFLHASHDHPMRLQPLAQVQLRVWVCLAFIVPLLLLKIRAC